MGIDRLEKVKKMILDEYEVELGGLDRNSRSWVEYSWTQWINSEYTWAVLAEWGCGDLEDAREKIEDLIDYLSERLERQLELHAAVNPPSAAAAPDSPLSHI